MLLSRLWAGLRANIAAGTRLALMLPVRVQDFHISAGHYAVLVGTSFLAWLLGGMLRGGFPGTVDPGALIAGLGQLPLVLLACLLAATLLQDGALTIALAVLITSTDPVFELVATLLGRAASTEVIEPYAALLNAAFIFWGVVTLLRAQHVAAGWRGLRSAGAAALLVGLLAVFVWAFPRAELWTPETEPISDTPPSLMREDVFHLQGALLDDQLDDLEAERPGVEDLYFLGVASDASQDAAVAELDSVRRLMEKRFDTAGRSLVLVNNSATLTALPIATATNLADALAGLGDLINADEDVVFLFLSSRASAEQELSFTMPPLALDPVNPTRLARTLEDSGIKWRVIVISACYSGGFIEPLKDDNTLIITASDATHASSACESTEDRSLFSRAFFGDGLGSSHSFVDAFSRARAEVIERDASAGRPGANPQIYVGAAIKEKLDHLQKRLESREPNRPSVRASR